MSRPRSEARHIGTIIVDGVPLLSYKADPGRVLSPSTMPSSLWPIVAQFAGHLDRPPTNATGLGWDFAQERTETIAPNVYRRRMACWIDVGVIPSHSMGYRVAPSSGQYET